MARQYILVYPLANNTLIAPVQSLSAAGFFQLNGDYQGSNLSPNNTGYPYAPATIPKMGRTLSFTSAGDQSAFTITPTGLDIYGNLITEDITGPNANTVQSTLMYHILFNVAVDGAIDDTSIGTGIGADFGWIVMDTEKINSLFTLQSSVGGTINYVVTRTAQVLYTLPTSPSFSPVGPIDADGYALPTPLNPTTSSITSLDLPTSGFNLIVSGSGGGTDATGTLILTILQQGSINA